MTELSTEIIYNILINLPYNDIMNYCSTNSSSNVLCHDPYFWMNKLDHDFVPVRGTYPSNYVNTYSINKGKETYKRWITSNVKTLISNVGLTWFEIIDIINTNIDIIMYQFDEYNDYTLKLLITYALQKHNIDILFRFDASTLNRLGIDTTAILTPMNYTLPLLQFLDRIGMQLSQYDINSATFYASMDTLLWLESKQYMPNVDGINSVACDMNKLLWFEKRGILPTQTGADYASGMR